MQSAVSLLRFPVGFTGFTWLHVWQTTVELSTSPSGSFLSGLFSLQLWVHFVSLVYAVKSLQTYK